MLSLHLWREEKPGTHLLVGESAARVPAPPWEAQRSATRQAQRLAAVSGQNKAACARAKGQSLHLPDSQQDLSSFVFCLHPAPTTYTTFKESQYVPPGITCIMRMMELYVDLAMEKRRLYITGYIFPIDAML